MASKRNGKRKLSEEENEEEEPQYSTPVASEGNLNPQEPKEEEEPRAKKTKVSGPDPHSQCSPSSSVSSSQVREPSQSTSIQASSSGSQEQTHQTIAFLEKCVPEEFSLPPLTQLKHSQKRPALSRADLLITVANENEWEAAMSILEPLDGAIWTYSYESQDYWIGKIGDAKAVVVQSQVASTGKYGSSQTVKAAITVWKPRLVVGLGVAFGTPHRFAPKGKENRNLRIGDVLVSTDILPYEHRRITDGEPDQLRDDIITIREEVINKLKKATRTFHDDRRLAEEERPGRKRTLVFFGPLLSGSKLVDSPTEHRKLVELYPHKIPLGGEMEGCGIADAMRLSQLVPFVIIKSICDWGFGKGKQFQRGAAVAAARFLEHAVKDRLLDDVPATDAKTVYAAYSQPVSIPQDYPAHDIAEDLAEAIQEAKLAKEVLDRKKKSPEYISKKKELKELIATEERAEKRAKEEVAGLATKLDELWTWDSDTVKVGDNTLTRCIGGIARLTQGVVAQFVSPYTLHRILLQARSGDVQFRLKTKKSSDSNDDSEEPGDV